MTTPQGMLADELKRLCCAETEGKFFDCVTDNIDTIIAALSRQAAQGREALEQRAIEMRNAIDMIEGALMGFGDLVDLPDLFEGQRDDLEMRVPATAGEVRRVCTALAECTRIINSDEFNPEALALAPAVAPDAGAGEWRCFHCGEVFTDADAAKEHFGPDTEWEAGCVDPLTKDEQERRKDQVDMYTELNREREENSRLANRDYILGCFERDLAKHFNGAKSVHQAFLMLDAMEGRALAAEEKLAALAGEDVTLPIDILRNCGCPSTRLMTVGECTDRGTCGCSLPSAVLSHNGTRKET